MNKNRKRVQAPKRIDRHTSSIADKRPRMGAVQSAPRYNRRKDGAW